MKNDLAIFEDFKIRRAYDEEKEIWYFSIIDIVQILTQQGDYQTARKYWNNGMKVITTKNYLSRNP